MASFFQSVGVAVSFSPYCVSLLREAKRFKDVLGSKLFLIHIGEFTKAAEKHIQQLAMQVDLHEKDYTIISRKGDPAELIIKISKDQKLSLLIMGALEKENFIKYYLGSVARKVMRMAPSNVLVITPSSHTFEGFKNICVSIDYSADSEYAVKCAYEIALLNSVPSITLIREVQTPGLAITVHDSGSTQETDEARKRWQEEELAKMKFFARELHCKNVTFELVCLIGKKGVESVQYMEHTRGDLLVSFSHKKSSSFWDRVFQNDLEYIFEKLPRAFLLVKRG